MDISCPTIIKINNRHYRCLHQTNFKQRSRTPIKPVLVDEYDDEDMTNLEDFPVGGEVTNLEENLIVEQDESNDLNDVNEDDQVDLGKLINIRGIRIKRFEGQFVIEVHVPNCLRGYLIGKNCSNIKEICSKTNVQIDFPQQHRHDDPFVIIGASEDSVLKAFGKIDELIQAKRRTTNLTHFMSFKCVNAETKSNYDKFKEIVKSKYLPQGYPDEVFIGNGNRSMILLVKK